jgi:hypothetical protein
VQLRDSLGRFAARTTALSTPTSDSVWDFLPTTTQSTRASSRLSESYDIIAPSTQASTPFNASPTVPTKTLPPQITQESEDMAETVTPFHGDQDDESPEFFLRAFYRRMADKSDETKKLQFLYYLQPHSVADEWFADLVDDEKKSWTDIEAAFHKRWPNKKPVKKTDEEYEDELVGRKLKVEDLGKKEKVAGLEVYTHVAWADRMATTVKSAKLEKATTHIRQVRRELPDIIREKAGTGHADWNAFLQAIRDIDVDYIRDYMDRQSKDAEVKKAIDQRIRMLETVSRSPTAPLRQQLSTVSITSQPPATNTAVVGDPFANTSGGQGNLRFATPATPRQPRLPFQGFSPRPPPTMEQKAEIRALLTRFPHHPDTQAGRMAHQAQQAEWVKTFGYGTRVTEKTPYPLRPGTAPVNSGECFSCGQLGHLGARTGENCEALGFRVLHTNEQQWRVICARVLKEPRQPTNINLVAIDDYGTTLQDIQGNGEGPSS